jgi:hypothetical protein
MAQIAYNPKFQAFDSAGDPLAGGLLYTYDAGTTTPKTTWADSGEVTPSANPIILDSRGEATIYGNGSYKFVLKDSADATIWTVDNIAIGGTVVTADIADGAVTTAKLPTNVLSADSTGRGKMQDGFVTSAKLDTGGVTLPNGSLATTQSDEDNSTKVATTAYVDTRVNTDRVIVGRTYAETTAYNRITTAASAIDDTVPLSSECSDVVSVAYTCATNTNRVRITFTVSGQCFATSAAVVSVWQDTTNKWSSVMFNQYGTGEVGSRTGVVEFVPGTTSSVTYAIKLGVVAPGYFDVCGYGGARAFGGVNKSSIVIEEIQS